MRLAHLLRFLLISFLLFLPGCIGKIQDQKSDSIFRKLDYPPPTEFEYIIFQHINRVRLESNLSPYKYDNRLGYIARLYAKRMYYENFFGHIDKEGRDVAMRLLDNRYMFFSAGENIIYLENINCNSDYLQNSRRVVTGWLTSVGHRRLILNDIMENVGIGVFCKDNMLYVTMLVSATCQNINAELIEGYVFTYDIGKTNYTVPQDPTVHIKILDGDCSIVNVNIISNQTLIPMDQRNMIGKISLPFQIAINSPFKCNASVEVCFRNDLE